MFRNQKILGKTQNWRKSSFSLPGQFSFQKKTLSHSSQKLRRRFYQSLDSLQLCLVSLLCSVNIFQDCRSRDINFDGFTLTLQYYYNHTKKKFSGLLGIRWYSFFYKQLGLGPSPQKMHYNQIFSRLKVTQWLLQSREVVKLKWKFTSFLPGNDNYDK